MRDRLIKFLSFKNPAIDYFRSLLFVVAIASGIGCATLSIEVRSYTIYPESSELSNNIIADTGLNGGAIGLGIISGMCFLGMAVTFLRKD